MLGTRAGTEPVASTLVLFRVLGVTGLSVVGELLVLETVLERLLSVGLEVTRNKRIVRGSAILAGRAYIVQAK